MSSSAAAYASSLAAELEADTLERFLRYVRIDTQSDRDSRTYPSTAKQLDLSRLLVGELQALGLDDPELSEPGYVLATLPARGVEGGPTIGLLAHVDTSPDEPGGGVTPQIWRDYDGGEIVLPGDRSQVLSPTVSPLLAERVGHDIVTSDGTTLLGADDKAGVAEIMAAVAYLAAHPELSRPRVRIAFTVDEEVGHGTDHFDLEHFGADLAYTVDGSVVGEIENETFSAVELTVVFHGVGVHPGKAKGKLVNAIKAAARFVTALPADRLSPETTEKREGYVHPHTVAGGVGETAVTVYLRAFEREQLEEQEALVRRLAEEAAAGGAVTIERWEQYRNLRETLDRKPRIVEAALAASRRVGLEPTLTQARGGTDGSRLTELGLPTPNLYAGGNEFHSRREWISVQDLAISAATVVELVRLWAEPEWRP